MNTRMMGVGLMFVGFFGSYLLRQRWHAGSHVADWGGGVLFGVGAMLAFRA